MERFLSILRFYSVILDPFQLGRYMNLRGVASVQEGLEYVDYKKFMTH